DDLRERALGAVRAYGRGIERSPRAFATTLSVVDLLLEGAVELAFVGPQTERAPLEAVVARHYLPNRVVAHGDPAGRGGLAAEPRRAVGRGAPCWGRSGGGAPARNSRTAARGSACAATSPAKRR